MRPDLYLFVVCFVNGAVGRYLVDNPVVLDAPTVRFREVEVDYDKTRNDAIPLISQGRTQMIEREHCVAYELIELTADQAAIFTQSKRCQIMSGPLPGESVTPPMPQILTMPQFPFLGQPVGPTTEPGPLFTQYQRSPSVVDPNSPSKPTVTGG